MKEHIKLGMDAGAPVRVLVIDDKLLVREALVDLLSAEPGLEVVGAVGDVRSAIQLAGTVQPDAVLVDVRTPGEGGADVARRIAELCPAARVLSLPISDKIEEVAEMLGAGAIAQVVRGCGVGQLTQALRGFSGGVLQMSPEITTAPLRRELDRLRWLRRDLASREERRARVRNVLDRDLLKMVFQPIFDLRSGRPTSFEALARFNARPQRPPDAWFGEAADVGLGLELELAAAECALAGLPALAPELSVSVNASPQTAASERFADLVLAREPSRTVVEVTEHARIDDYGELAARLQALRAEGVELAIDDAGSGFASLRHVVELRPDIVKLDRNLTHGIDRDDGRQALAAGLVSFTSKLGGRIVAEGVETDRELTALLELGVGHGQGYLLGRPAPLSDMANLARAV